jgi:hypothetical protein
MSRSKLKLKLELLLPAVCEPLASVTKAQEVMRRGTAKGPGFRCCEPDNTSIDIGL